jgi:hypothetical protein
MPINLSDIPNAVTEYLRNQVTTVVNRVEPDVTGELQPGEDGTFSVAATNAAAPLGVRVVDIRYHLRFNTPGVAKFHVPSTPPARATSNSNDPVLVPFTQVDEMFLFPADTALLVGETDAVRALTIHGVAVGDATIKCHIHGSILEEDLFPKASAGRDGERAFTVS